MAETDEEETICSTGTGWHTERKFPIWKWILYCFLELPYSLQFFFPSYVSTCLCSSFFLLLPSWTNVCTLNSAVVGWKMASKDVYILITLEPVTVLPYVAKGTLQIWLRLKTLRWGGYSVLSRWVQCNHRVLKIEEGGRRELGKCGYRRSQGDVRSCSCCFEDGVMS